jgi:hypothetical protein
MVEKSNSKSLTEQLYAKEQADLNNKPPEKQQQIHHLLDEGYVPTLHLKEIGPMKHEPFRTLPKPKTPVGDDYMPTFDLPPYLDEQKSKSKI